MDRAEFKRMNREIVKKKKTFVLTQAQIDQMKEDAVQEATERAFFFMLAMPLEVLITEEYWKKSAKKKIPKFINDLIKLYKAYEEGSISIKEMEGDLWKFAGIKCEPMKK